MSNKTKLTYFAQKLDGQQPELETPDEIQEFWENAPAGRYTVQISKPRKAKTKKQLGTIFGLMMESVIAQANDLGIDTSYFLQYLVKDDLPKGQGLTKDFIHELMYVVCPTTDDEGKRVTLSKMNTKQAAELFEGFRNLMAPLGIVVPDPDPEWKEKEGVQGN